MNKSLDYQEQKAVAKIKQNPKFFYSYAKRFANVKSTISMLYDSSGTVKTDKGEIADILQKQFSSVYSDPNSPLIKNPDFTPASPEMVLEEEDFIIGDSDVMDAIDQINANSSCGPDGIPAILLKKCKSQLCKPIRLIWTESFQTGIVPKYYKTSYVTPLFKKGNRVEASNYRPISLTSHIIKIYERILRQKIVYYLEANNLLCHNQHGFRSGRSCLTQLLSHFDDILNGFTNNVDTDSIYLDYAKAFDKVDHNLLLSKLRLYGFNPKLVD